MSIVQQQIRIVRIKNFINHLILDCVRPDKPTASSWTCETASCSTCQQSLDAAGIRQRYKVINENTFKNRTGKSREYNVDVADCGAGGEEPAQGSMCSHRAKGLLIRQYKINV